MIENIKKLIYFRKKCNSKKIKLYIANNYKLAKKIIADGLYLSAYNKKIYNNINVIGSAHNHKEISRKIKQKCKAIILSRLFKTSYKNKVSFYGLAKFNLISKKYDRRIKKKENCYIKLQGHYNKKKLETPFF